MPKPWYAEGLAFECVRCGRCCRGPGGYVWLNEGEIDAMASALTLTREDFGRRWLRATPEGPALIDAANGDCPFLTAERGCRVYGGRPAQCRTWPWWPDNLGHPEDWALAARRCPGVGTGPVYSRVFIEAELAKFEASRSDK